MQYRPNCRLYVLGFFPRPVSVYFTFYDPDKDLLTIRLHHAVKLMAVFYLTKHFWVSQMTEKGVESPPRLVWRTQNKKENWNWKQPESWRQMWSWCCCSSCVRGCSVQLQASTTSLSMSLSLHPHPHPHCLTPKQPPGSNSLLWSCLLCLYLPLANHSFS